MSDEQMTITINSYNVAELVTVSGRIDSNTAPQLDKALQDLLEGGKHKIVLELSGVEYMSSAGLRALVSAKKSKGDVRLSTVSDRVLEVLELSGLDNMFEMYPDSTAAIGSF